MAINFGNCSKYQENVNRPLIGSLGRSMHLNFYPLGDASLAIEPNKRKQLESSEVHAKNVNRPLTGSQGRVKSLKIFSP
jgi:hypothetical protein